MSRILEQVLGHIERSSPDDIKIALIYTTILKLPPHHPFRATQHRTESAARDYLALIYGREPEWVQEAFEERARTLG